MLDRLTIERLRWAAGETPILVALSGGGDSVALLHLLAAELGAARLRAAVVDHALRHGSSADAVRAQAIAQALGVRADVLTLIWRDGGNRAQQAAREARYAALCAHARLSGARVIVTGHTADDQAETVIMRARAGSTWRGLAGIAPFCCAPVWPEGRGLVLARPLLDTRRETLRFYLRERQLEWIEDPANGNDIHERVRVRARLQKLEQQGFAPMRLARLAQNLRRRAHALDVAALDLIGRAANLEEAIRLDRAAWQAPAAVRGRALSVLIAAAAGASREPPASEIEMLEARVMDPKHRGSTHSGVAFAVFKDAVVLKREPAAILGRADGAPPLRHLELTPGVEAVWDGRYAVTVATPGWRLVPASNGEFSLCRDGQVDARAVDLVVRPLASDRVLHAFAPDINRAKP